MIDPYFVALKARFEAPHPDTPIRWDQVFNLDRESFQKHAPDLLEEVETALNTIQGKSYGQALFRDIVMNEHRTARVDIVVENNEDDVSPGFYDMENDAIIFNPSFDVKVGSLPEELRNAYNEQEKVLGLSLSEILLLHEGDHAARMYGLDTPYVFVSDGKMAPDSVEWLIANGCYEELAMKRANEFRAENGMSLRTNYNLPFDQKEEKWMQEIADDEFVQLEEMQKHGVYTMVYDWLIDELIEYEGTSSTCDNPPTVEEVIAISEKRANTILKKLDIPINLGENSKEAGDVTEPPAHGLTAQTTDSSQRSH